jgi:NAD(P)-dependent dehydrogenase (short-subunit alcohol dehydrogenase family)
VRDIENLGGETRFIAADVSDADDVRRLATEAGEVDILIDDAGIYRFAPTVDTTDADFDDQININLRAPRGHGTVINVTTVAASTPAAGASIHGASKGATPAGPHRGRRRNRQRRDSWPPPRPATSTARS